MQTASSGAVRQMTVSIPGPYPGQEIPTEGGHIVVKSVMRQTGKVWFTINGGQICDMAHAEFCSTFMAG